MQMLRDYLSEKLENEAVTCRKIESARSRVSNAEKRISDLENQRAADGNTLKDLARELNSLQTKFTSLEGYNRRNNLVFVGLEEGIEAGNLDKMICDILRYILDLKDDDPTPEVERQHRTLRPRLAPAEPPRPYLVRMLRWGDRQRNIEAVAKKKQLY
ncbi:hypothetical protein ABVT39_005926 [Epinephelus coioides]